MTWMWILELQQPHCHYEGSRPESEANILRVLLRELSQRNRASIKPCLWYDYTKRDLSLYTETLCPAVLIALIYFHTETNLAYEGKGIFYNLLSLSLFEGLSGLWPPQGFFTLLRWHNFPPPTSIFLSLSVEPPNYILEALPLLTASLNLSSNLLQWDVKAGGT